jgi:hypothetical protein
MKSLSQQPPAPEHTHAQQQHAQMHIWRRLLKLDIIVKILGCADERVKLRARLLSINNFDAAYHNFGSNDFGSGGARDSPSHTLKNGGGNLQHADSRVLLGPNVNSDAVRVRKRV